MIKQKTVDISIGTLNLESEDDMNVSFDFAGDLSVSGILRWDGNVQLHADTCIDEACFIGIVVYAVHMHGAELVPKRDWSLPKECQQ